MSTAAAEIAERGAAAGLKFYQFSFVDLFGVQRSKLVPASRVAEIAEGGAGFAGFAAHLDMDPTMGDLLAVPDAATLTPLPWQPEVGWLSCNLVHEDTELAHGPRNVLRSVQAKPAVHGVALKTGVECEFFLLDGSAPAARPALSDPLDAKPCYDAHALMRRYELISTLVSHMEQLGWGPYQADHEDANGPDRDRCGGSSVRARGTEQCRPFRTGQFEINWDFDDALARVTADRVVLFKYMVRSLAERAGLRATFMPKPFASLTGSGCHAHMHGLSPLALSFTAGLLAHAPALTALTNPTVNSYKRLGARMTSSGATWCTDSPAARHGQEREAEPTDSPADSGLPPNRLADMSANPYLMAAAIGAAGLDGLRARSVPPPPTDRKPRLPEITRDYPRASPPLPSNLAGALEALDASSPLRSGLGDAFVDSYLKLRRAHWAEYMAQLTPWELETYLDA
ncbi:putative glutamine synthetase [Emiliania huxleyi CCMP1516]|uniref:Glutamine synthetase n=2 Tax=Emiliania huxleyi TaxID=2903 RepID=A0A0D3JZJ3_EMIH1|nr:putative glutamine synthetase [Emiliania huxleyi CCMP1516]EOD28928.1 putative glutamine synthetase [Emiliania huxleyi CCMP1516]|eukprot:XP_005781357.1 putative glutamine synthetase [Emiliania huxleyi CCMP1516]